MNPVIAIIGPTATGKSHLAFSLAKALNGEIISADSQQVYRYMDIGTAKPSREEQDSIPHHLIDIVDPDEPFSLALYQPLACKAIESIRKRGKTPLLVGGSGLYVWSIIDGWTIPRVAPDTEFRSQMEERALKEGYASLHRELEGIDPAAAGKIDPRNLRRVIRALEVCKTANTPFSRLQQKEPPPFDTIIIGLTSSREELYRRIDHRVDNMMRQGLVKEVESMVSRGYGFDLPSMSGLGYKQIAEFLQGKWDLPGAVRQIKFDTHRFARHQYAWFRPRDPRIHWFDIQNPVEESILRLVSVETKSLK